jgi:hypothetical protein
MLIYGSFATSYFRKHPTPATLKRFWQNKSLSWFTEVRYFYLGLTFGSISLGKFFRVRTSVCPTRNRSVVQRKFRGFRAANFGRSQSSVFWLKLVFARFKQNKDCRRIGVGSKMFQSKKYDLTCPSTIPFF